MLKWLQMHHTKVYQVILFCQCRGKSRPNFLSFYQVAFTLIHECVICKQSSRCKQFPEQMLLQRSEKWDGKGGVDWYKEHPPEYHLKIRLKHDEIIKAKHTHIIKEDGGIAMAQLANLPSRLFHILFGQPPREGEKAQDRKQWIKKHKTTQRVLLAKTVTSESFTAIGKRFYGCQLKIKVLSFISSTATQCQNNNSNRTRTQYSKYHYFHSYAVHIWLFFQCSLMSNVRWKNETFRTTQLCMFYYHI